MHFNVELAEAKTDDALNNAMLEHKAMLAQHGKKLLQSFDQHRDTKRKPIPAQSLDKIDKGAGRAALREAFGDKTTGAPNTHKPLKPLNPLKRG